MLRRTALGMVAAAVVAAAAVVGVPVLSSGPAQAAACGGADGITVVVDFNGLGGGVPQVCVGDTDAKENADALFAAAGFALRMVDRQPGFVCRVNDKPADANCVNTPPASAYWALFWTDGESGKWVYSNSGVGSLQIPEGGAVAFSYDEVEGMDHPSAAAPKHAAPSPSPTVKQSDKPSAKPTDKPETSAPDASTPSTAPTSAPTSDSTTAATPDARARDDVTEGRQKKRRERGLETPVPLPSDYPSSTPDVSIDDADTTPTAAEPSPDGLPGWVPPLIVGVLFLAGGGLLLARRLRG